LKKISLNTIRLRPKKKNDGTPENYFLDMVLYINDEPVADDDSTRFELPKTKEVREAKRRTKNALDEKLKTLKQKKARKKFLGAFSSFVCGYLTLLNLTGLLSHPSKLCSDIIVINLSKIFILKIKIYSLL
jgi:hypothetical protein